MPVPKPDAANPRREQFVFVLDDGREVEITQLRHPRARRIRLAVDERGVRLTLPERSSVVQGRCFLAEHGGWLAIQLARLAAHAPPQAVLVPWQTAALPLRGEALPLQWREAGFTRISAEGDGGIVIALPSRVTPPVLARALQDFYTAQARADVGRWLPRYLSGLPGPPRSIRFKQLSSLWGSLSPAGDVSLDLSLVLARPAAFEYVLVHELCHLLQRNHSPAFWREVERRFGDWRPQRDYFRQHGGMLKHQLAGLLAPR